jgi:hypothetical protein
MSKRKSLYRHLLFAILVLAAPAVQAQVLSQEDKEELQIRTKQKIEDLQGHLSTIASRSVSPALKDIATRSALKLFIAKGDSYYYEDAYRKRTLHDPVIMQVSSKYRATPINRPMKQYLNSLRNMTRYSKVVIENADVVRVDNIRETAEGKYEAVAYFCQKFCGYRDGKLIYNDVTEKKVKVYVEREEVAMPDGETQVIWLVLLGDIYVVSTQ